MFLDTPDPIIHEIKPLTSFSSGGRIVAIHGEYLDSATTAKLLVYDTNGSPDSVPFATNCHIFTSRLMECRTPALRDIFPNEAEAVRARGTSESSPLGLQIGLHMDNVTSLRVLHRFRLNYVSDPTYENFTNNLKIYKGDALVIEGHSLNMASDQNEVRVAIGNDYCNVTSLTPTQLLCIPPAQQPPPGDVSSELPEVTVLVGTKLRYKLGYVRYNTNGEEFISSEVIGAISAVTAILVSIGIVILIVLKHKSTQVRELSVNKVETVQFHDFFLRSNGNTSGSKSKWTFWRTMSGASASRRLQSCRPI